MESRVLNSLMPKFTTEELNERGKRYLKANDEALVDSAMLCYTIISERYDADDNEEMKALILNAMIQKAHLFFFYYFDYPQAIEAMVKVEDIMERTGIILPKAYFSYGLMQLSLGAETSDDGLVAKGFDLLLKAFETAKQQGDYHIMNMTIGNLLSQKFTYPWLLQVDKQWEEYIACSPDSMTVNTKARIYNNHAIHDAIVAINKGNIHEADSVLEDLMANLPEGLDFIRFHITAIGFQINSRMKLGLYEQSVPLIHRALEKSEKYQLRDETIYLLGMLRECYDSLNEKDSLVVVSEQYYAQKDSLLNYRQMRLLTESKFFYQLNRTQEEIAAVNTKLTFTRILAIALSVILLLSIVFVVVVVVKNKKIKQADNTIFLKDQEIMSNISYPKSFSSSNQIIEENTENSCIDKEKEINRDCSSNKYKSSNLSNERKDTIYSQINAVIEDLHQLCDPDFSIEKLAQAIGSNTTYVSQVINELYGMNFVTLVNNRRIREACRRLTQGADANRLTIEAIAESIGYRSRTTFITQFKRVTGLTPSKYRYFYEQNTQSNSTQ